MAQTMQCDRPFYGKLLNSKVLSNAISFAIHFSRDVLICGSNHASATIFFGRLMTSAFIMYCSS